MSKVWAKIVVQKWSSECQAGLVSDAEFLGCWGPRETLAQAKRRADQWSRRLGGIPVEVEDG